MFDAYGTNLTGSTGEPWGFEAQSGYYTDTETGLTANTYRYYDPSQGRWLNRDPIGQAGGINVYAYVGNGPVGGVDPDGTVPDWIAAIGNWWMNLWRPTLQPGTPTLCSAANHPELGDLNDDDTIGAYYGNVRRAGAAANYTLNRCAGEVIVAGVAGGSGPLMDPILNKMGQAAIDDVACRNGYTMELRERIAQAYEQLAETLRLRGKAEKFIEYNLERARYMRGGCDSLSHTVNDFASERGLE